MSDEPKLPGAGRIPGMPQRKGLTKAAVPLAELSVNDQRKRLGLPYAPPALLERKAKQAGRRKLQSKARKKNRRR